jgi:hypothetical protein
VTCLRMAPMRRPYVCVQMECGRRRAEDGLEGSSHRHACRYGGGWSFGGGLIIGIAPFEGFLLASFDRDPDAVRTIDRVRP